jgi:hypothetical protein
MAARVKALSILQRFGITTLCGHFPPVLARRGCRIPPARFSKGLNTLLYVLITGYRWYDRPRGAAWASKTATHRWLQRWQADRTGGSTPARILRIAEERGQIQGQYGTVEGSFSP